MSLPKKKNYPKKLFIGGDEYKVQFVKRFKESNTMGYTDAGLKVIRLSEKLTPEEMFKTFIHEVLHAIEFSHPVEIKHRTIYELSDALYDFFECNFIGG